MPACGGKRPIAIVGGGIAGLTLALELSRCGLYSVIFEQAERLESAGAGIQLSANALRVLDRLGLMPALQKAASSADSVALRSYSSGRLIAEVPVASADGTPYLSIHRADLQAALVNAVEAQNKTCLHLGHTLSGVSPAEDGVRLAFRTNAGEIAVNTPLVIGADGVHSTLAALLGLSGAVTTQFVAWRAEVEEPTSAPSQGIQAWLGPRCHAITYPIDRGRRTNLVLIGRSANGRDGENSRIVKRFGRVNARLGATLTSAEKLEPWSLCFTPRDRRWRHLGDHALLVGDAAHGLLPYAAQGAGMAIEDAAVLSDRLFREDNLSTALAAYEAERRTRIQRVRRRVGFHRFVYHLPAPFSFGRDAVLALRSPESLRQDLGWLYDWRPPE